VKCCICTSFLTLAIVSVKCYMAENDSSVMCCHVIGGILTER